MRTSSRRSSAACASRSRSPRLRATSPWRTAATEASPPESPGGREPQASGGGGERLQKYLARAGLGSRRACEELIADGRVTIEGRVAVLGDRVVAGVDDVALDGVPVRADGELVYYLLNKPVGVVTTSDDPQGRSTVVQLVPASPRVFSVGRLDVATSGLLVLTNDGALTELLTHPRHGVDKTYVAEVDGTPGRAALTALRKGVELDDGPTAPARCRVLSTTRGRTLLEIVIHEGRKRQVRRMCEAVGHPVRSLARTRIGPLHDARLGPGEWRPLTPREVRALYATAGERDTTSGRREPRQ